MDFSDVDRDELERLRRLYRPLTEAVRDLVDATLLSEVDEETIRKVQVEIVAATDKLRARQSADAFGTHQTGDGEWIAWGNAAVGLRNAAAPPLVIQTDETAGLVWSDVTLRAIHEGPPGLVHGGVAALILDHVLGVAGSLGGGNRRTGTLTLRYRQGTPIGPVHAEARIVHIEGRKATVQGTLSAANGVTVEAEGIFITPAAVAEAMIGKPAIVGTVTD